MALVSKILEQTLAAGSTAVTFTDSDIPNSLIRVFSSNSDVIPESRILSGNTLTVTYAPQSSNMDVALEMVKQGLDIVDNVLSEDTDKALSAKQGYLLDAAIGDVNDRIDGLVIPDNITDLDDVNVTSISDGQILEWDSVSEKFVNATPQASVENMIYSTTPQKVGKWIDNKDIYRCVYDLTNDLSIANNDFTSTGIDASDMGILLDVKGIYSTGVTVYNLMGNVNNSILRAQADRNNNPASCRYIIVLYVES